MKKKLDKEEAVSALRGKIERLLANSLNPSYEKHKGLQASKVTPEGKAAGEALLLLCKPILNFPNDVIHRKVYLLVALSTFTSRPSYI